MSNIKNFCCKKWCCYILMPAMAILLASAAIALGLVLGVITITTGAT